MFSSRRGVRSAIEERALPHEGFAREEQRLIESLHNANHGEMLLDVSFGPLQQLRRRQVVVAVDVRSGDVSGLSVHEHDVSLHVLVKSDPALDELLVQHRAPAPDDERVLRQRSLDWVSEECQVSRWTRQVRR